MVLGKTDMCDVICWMHISNLYLHNAKVGCFLFLQCHIQHFYACVSLTLRAHYASGVGVLSLHRMRRVYVQKPRWIRFESAHRKTPSAIEISITAGSCKINIVCGRVMISSGILCRSDWGYHACVEGDRVQVERTDFEVSNSPQRYFAGTYSRMESCEFSWANDIINIVMLPFPPYDLWLHVVDKNGLRQ